MGRHRDASAFESATALVTGGAGCIGANLVAGLLARGARRVVVLDDLSAGVRWNVPAEPRVRFVRGSVLDDGPLRSAFRTRPDLVFHLAALFANQNSVDHPERDLLVNGLGTLRVLERARRARAGRFLYASSGCSVYGARAPLPLAEDFVSLHLDTPYQVTKLLGELYANYFANLHGLDVVNLRFFNVYGPGEVPGRYRNVIPNFLWRAMHGRSLPITGTGRETRDFTYVGDVVEGALAAATSPRAAGEAINLASGRETRIADLARRINRLTGNRAGIVRRPRRAWDRTERRRASIAKARRLLGYAPRTSLEAGLQATHAWMQDHRRHIAAAARS